MTALTSPTVRQPRPRKPKMTTDLHEYIRRRDQMCFLYRLDQTHICASQWGVSHSPFNLGALTVGHVWDDHQTLGLRPPNDKWHLVAMCWKGNVGCPSAAVREAERAFLREVEP